MSKVLGQWMRTCLLSCHMGQTGIEERISAPFDGEEQLVLTDVAKEVESDPEVEISDVDEEELHLSEPEDPQVTQEELRHELDDLEETTGPVQEQFSQMFLVESSSGNICIDQGTGCDEFLNKFDFQQENEFMLADPELQFFVHYQAQDRIPNSNASDDGVNV